VRTFFGVDVEKTRNFSVRPRKKLLPDLIKAVTKRAKYPYIVIDLSPHSDTDYRLRTDIFPGELTRVYALKS